jgi:hypothetical protein
MIKNIAIILGSGIVVGIIIENSSWIAGLAAFAVFFVILVFWIATNPDF